MSKNKLHHPPQKKNTIDYNCHFRNGKGNGAEMCPAIVSEIVIGDAIGHSFLVPSYSLRSLYEN